MVESLIPATRPPRHLPQLDSLRTFAVAGVMVYHFTNGAWGDGAYYGVRLFFVLSGFLITRLLIQAHDRVAAGERTRAGALGRFYARRTLRIFPLYYAVVFAALLVDLEPAREIYPWLLSYTVNVRFALQGHYDLHFAHFWSLSVEEQFYLVWPFIVVAAPRRLWPAFTLGLIALGPLSRRLLVDLPGGDIASYVLTPASGDALGVGAWLAVMQAGVLRQRLVARASAWLFGPWGTLLSLAASGLAIAGWMGAAGDLVHGVGSSLVFGGLVAAACRGVRGPAGALLDARPVQYVGRVSYGVYVYHPFVLAALPGLQGSRSEGVIANAAAFAAFCALTIGVSAASWHLFEKPLNDLKARF